MLVLAHLVRHPVANKLLHEGASVTVLVRENGEGFEVTPEEELELLRAVADADRGDLVSSEQVLERLRRRLV
jgi:hypothetical protein